MAIPTAEEPRRDRAALASAFDREARRMGSVATLHNHAVADAAGLHDTDQQCIDLLDWAEPLTAGEIAVHLGLTSGAVTGLMDRLEAGGWIHRERDPDDRRRVVVQLSRERSGDLAPLYAALAREIGGFRDRLSDDELCVVVRFLEFANAAIEKATTHARVVSSG